MKKDIKLNLGSIESYNNLINNLIYAAIIGVTAGNSLQTLGESVNCLGTTLRNSNLFQAFVIKEKMQVNIRAISPCKSVADFLIWAVDYKGKRIKEHALLYTSYFEDVEIMSGLGVDELFRWLSKITKDCYSAPYVFRHVKSFTMDGHLLNGTPFNITS